MLGPRPAPLNAELDLQGFCYLTWGRGNNLVDVVFLSKNIYFFNLEKMPH